MSGRRVRRSILATAETVIPFIAKAINLGPRSKILLLGTFAASLLVVLVPILFRSDAPPIAASSTLKCYDSAKNYEPCLTRASASTSRFNGQTTEAHQPPSWTTTALYQQATWATTAPDQQASWTTTAPDQQASWTNSAPVAQRGTALRKHAASAICGRRLIPCFFSALRRGVTHIAAVVTRPARERL